MATTYAEFLADKQDFGAASGFEPLYLHPSMFDFQQLLADWAIRKGRAAVLADCGLGKSLIELVWADNIIRKTNKPVLLLTPLAVGPQMVAEANKFGIECYRSLDGKNPKAITVANYQRLHLFDPSHYGGVVCDESGILKNFNGATKTAVTEFMRTIPYRLLCTATAAPNDYMELGTSSEALGYLGFQDMLSRFFTQKELKESSKGSIAGWGRQQREAYRLRGHAERDFWRFVVSWARACRKPSDLGCDDGPFQLPPLVCKEHVVQARRLREGMLYETPAVTLQEQSEDLRRTLQERCEKAAELVSNHRGASVMWCHLNTESSLLAKLAPNCVEISGGTNARDEEHNEESFLAFASGQIQNIVTKPSMGGFGMNWQHCHHQTYFPSHSFEQFYQGIRRSWRFGQKSPVMIDLVTTEGQAGVLANQQRKAKQADEMFSNLVSLMNDQLQISNKREFLHAEILPAWL